MNQTRRSVLSAIGLALPLGAASAVAAHEPRPRLAFRDFEDAVRAAFAGVDPSAGVTSRRVEVGACDELREGVQGCVNDRPFAGFPAGSLRIVRVGSEPGPARGGVRLYVTAVEIVLGGKEGGGRRLDFASIPAAPVLA